MRRLISNSLLSIAALLYAGLGCANTATPSGSGGLRIATTTTGTSLDADGYMLQFDRSSAAPSGQRLGANGNATLADLPAGTHQLGLLDVAANCLVRGANPRPVTIVADSAVDAAFEIHCAAPPTGDLVVRVATYGFGPDVNGYRLSLDGGAGQPVSDDDTVSLPDLRPGDHTLELSGVATNCSVQGANPRTVAVVAGAQVSTAFQVLCYIPGGGSLPITSDRSGGESHIWSLNGTGLSDLTPGADAADGDWSPDGRKIVFSSTRNGDSEIYVMDADGSNPVRLTNTDALAEGPRWSPDGTRIAFFFFGYRGWVPAMNADGSGLSS